MLSVIGFLGVAVAAALTRLWLVARFRWVGSDIYYHLILGDQVRRARRLRLPNDRFLVAETNDYPPLVPCLVAVWPAEHRRLLQYAGPAADFVTAAVVAGAAFWLKGPPAAVIAMAIYVSTPYAFDAAYSFGPRVLANLFLTLGLVALLFVDSLGAGGVFAAGLFGALVLLTHRLTAQSFLTCAAVLLVFAPEPALGSVAIALLLAVVLSGGFYISSLRGHIAFIRAVSSEIDFSIPKTFAKLAWGNPHLIALVYLTLTGEVQARSLILISWIVGLFLVAVLWPFGEGDRHFANASSLAAIFLALGDWSGTSWVIPVATTMAGVAIIVIKLAVYPSLARRGAGTIVTSELIEACSAIRSTASLRNPPLVLAWPQSLSYQVMYFAGARGFLRSGGTGSGLRFNRSLNRQLAERGLMDLPAGIAPDFVVCSHSAGLRITNESWSEVYRGGYLAAYQRRGRAQ